MHEEHRQPPLGAKGKSTLSKFEIGSAGPWEITIPHTVYPPREDTALLGRALLQLSGRCGRAVEIGCGSGALSILLASIGWRVTACDVNPFAVAAARGNVEKAGFADMVSIDEGGPGEPEWELQKGVDLVVWNLPYLDPPENDKASLEHIEEASMSDLPGGWSDKLLEVMDDELIDPSCLVVLLHRTDPDSRSKPDSWIRNGWSCRQLNSMRLADERLEVLCYWRSGAGESAMIMTECESTMDEAKRLINGGWQRVLSLSQTSGRGRRGSSWQTQEGGLACTWVLSGGTLERHSPGLIQTSVGAAVSDALGCYVKWPNDLVTEDGRKLGGVLVEGNSEDDGIRVGIGLNKRDSVIDGTTVAGWGEFVGEKTAIEVFDILDSAISSLFEEHSLVPPVEEEELVALSWKSLARSLSTGVALKSKGSPTRAVGLSSEGHLLIEFDGLVATIDDINTLDWNPIT
jgi:biotin-(acetyl-CoA carboxylase) ligase/SAM-dependent methyltransferase